MIKQIITTLYRHYSPEKLMLIIKEDNPLTQNHAFNTLYNKLAPTLLTNCFYIVQKEQIAEEIVNETFLTIFNQRHNFNPQKSFLGWITTIARNKSYNYLKKHKELLFDEREENNYNATEDLTIDSQLEQLIKQEDKQLIKECVLALPLTRREALELWINEYTTAEMAQILGKSEQAVKNLIFRAKKQLLENLKEAR